MNIQLEKNLEDQLIERLKQLGYQSVSVKDEDDLRVNFKTRLEQHNNISLSEEEFTQILRQMRKGSIFEKAKTLREKMSYTKDDGKTGYVDFLNTIDWCRNIFQVTSQITMKGKYENRYDITILINGLPLVQIELKRRGLELKEAFEQTKRYGRDSYASGIGLFQYIQLFVITNGVNTKYYANNDNDKHTFKQTFYWSDKENIQIKRLEQFADTFLDPCHLSKMICSYIVLNETKKILMILRPYQYYAVEEIIDRVKNTEKNGYIWHATGSGKTLTSFKTSQILKQVSDIEKVVFVVDRKDLDYQTVKEFNSFSKESIDGTVNTQKLVKQFNDPDTKLIVTTIQKLDVAIKNDRYKKVMERFQNGKMVFIFDECHRGQFGDTHKRIKSYFPKARLFGFTGTPILKENASGLLTTESLFEKCLHRYVITDAIRDESVLKFSLEYFNTVKRKEDTVDIDKSEVMDAPERLESIVNHIIRYHDRKTRRKEFTALFCVSRIPNLIKYYEIFKRKKEEGIHDLKIATIFSYQANEEGEGVKGFIMDDDELSGEPETTFARSREKLDAFIADYNKMFQTNYSTNNFYDYYNDISKKVKNGQVDILLVVNMFLTGFDSPTLNTLYVDKNLEYHGLIQAFSRTNRVFNEKKSQGNIVCFRGMKKETDNAIALFSDKDAESEIIMPPYHDFVKEFNEQTGILFGMAATVDDVDSLGDEEAELEFIKTFRELLRLMNKLKYFTEFTFDDLSIDEQTFEDYQSKYLDLYDKVHDQRYIREGLDVRRDVDYELELTGRDEINVAYVLRLLIKLKGQPAEEQENVRAKIRRYLTNEIRLRNKRILIERFLNEKFPKIEDEDDIVGKFWEFWNAEKTKAMEALCQEENLDLKKVQKLIENWLFTEIPPSRDEIIKIRMNDDLKLKERRPVAERIWIGIKRYIETFIEGL